MNERTKIYLIIAVGLWVAVFVFLFVPPDAPITFFPPDKVLQDKVRPRGSVTVSRNLIVHRAEHVYVLRTMIKGDCAKFCEILDLPAGQLTLEPGEYRDFRREHLIPTLATPGMWRLVFSVQWEDRLGRRITKLLPELTIEVVP